MVRLNDILSQARGLSVDDRISLIQTLSIELSSENLKTINLINTNQTYPVWSPEVAFEAASVMLETLSKLESKS